MGVFLCLTCYAPCMKLRLSASQIKTAKSCPRKWAWDKIEKKPRSSSPAAERGKRVHKHMEHYYQGKVPTPCREADIFYQALPYLPKPEPSTISEHQGNLIIDGVPYLLYIDVYDPTQHLIVDLKTSGNPRMYGLTDETIKADPQALIYALYHSGKHQQSGATLRWVYSATKGRREAYDVGAWMSHEEIVAGIEEHVLPTQEKLVQITKKGNRALDIEPNTKHCKDYGGCPYRVFCTDLDKPVIQEEIVMSGKQKDLFAGLVAIDEANGAAAHATKQAPALQPPETLPGLAVNPTPLAPAAAPSCLNGMASYAPVAQAFGDAFLKLAAVLGGQS